MAILFAVKFIFPGLNDPDFYWHLKTGEYIFSAQSLPTSDPFSYTFFGKKWILHEWLSEVIFFSLNQFFGIAGIKILIASICVLTFYVLLRTTQSFIKAEIKALAITVVFFAPNFIFITPRPQIFTYLFFALFLNILLEYKYLFQQRKLFYLPVIMAFWVNLHGAFMVGIALLLLFLVTEWLSFFIRPVTNKNSKRNLIFLTYISAATIIAATANPHHINIFIYPFEVVNMEASTSLIAEWRSPNFHLVLEKYYLFLIASYFLLLAYSNKKPDITEILLPTFFVCCGFIAVRHLPLTAITLLPFSAYFFSQLSSLFAFNVKYLSNISALKVARREISPAVTACLNVILLGTVLVVLVLSDATQKVAETEKRLLPESAANFILSHNISGNMLNGYGMGGYLIYRLGPDRKVFIDGRADVYGDQFMLDYIDIYTGTENWKEKFEKFSIDYVVCDKNAAIRQLLITDGSFKEVFFDGNYSVLLRGGPKHAEVFAKILAQK